MVWYFVNNLGLHRELQEWLMKKLQELAEQKGTCLYKEKLVDDVNTWHDHDEESMWISILQNKLRLGKLNTIYLSGRSFFLPCLCTIAKLIVPDNMETCIPPLPPRLCHACTGAVATQLAKIEENWCTTWPVDQLCPPWGFGTPLQHNFKTAGTPVLNTLEN